jgi:hypothetical protein
MYLAQLEKLYEEDKSPLAPLREKALEKLKTLPFPDRTVEEYRKIVESLYLPANLHYLIAKRRF